MTCPDCKGTKVITLLTSIEPCKRCAPNESQVQIHAPITLDAIMDGSGGVIGYAMAFYNSAGEKICTTPPSLLR